MKTERTPYEIHIEARDKLKKAIRGYIEMHNTDNYSFSAIEQSIDLIVYNEVIKVKNEKRKRD